MTVTYEIGAGATSDLNEGEGEGEKRHVWQSIRRGVRCRCPNCGEGRMFNRFLKVAPTCPACGEDLSHHRADDLPPYLTIVIVGHIVVTAILFVFGRWEWPTTVHLLVWLPLTFALCLALLQPTKGAVVGLQWALRMHGFARTSGQGDAFDDPDTEPGEGDTRPSWVS
ncbi:MAG: DUF983 domain-containing protein [Bauldia sp.]|nr:DUF983 domain-containing protein [Bauldia sp.]MCW5718884.1 DUF983 domain-containing protein [Bauldia sp.]